MILLNDSASTPIDETIDRIINLNSGMTEFWSSAEGWAPIEAAQLLSRSRLDWQVSLSKCLKLWLQSSSLIDEPGSLILAWANLGSLTEGTMKLFLSAWYESYKVHIDAFKEKGKWGDPDCLMLKKLRNFFNAKIWRENDEDWDNWIEGIQYRRNAIHAYHDRDISNLVEFFKDVRRYLEFLRYINGRLPYPDDVYIPSEV